VTDIWQQLGIRATSDLKAIKKAYAARLKHTRPDDDAAAYQALRQAYEAAQAQAKAQARWADLSWQVKLSAAAVLHVEEHGEPGDASAADHQRRDAPAAEEHGRPNQNEPALELVPPVAASDQKELEPASAPPASQPAWRSPDELVIWLTERLQADDADGMAADWQLAERELDALPLSMQAEASRCFADMVLAHDVPVAVENALLQRFGWLSDFRAFQNLGAQRAQALRARFGDRAAFIPDQAFLDRYNVVTVFAQGARRLKGWNQWLYIMLGSSQVRRLWRELRPEQRHAIGVDKAGEAHIEGALDWSLWSRFALFAAFGASVFGWREDLAGLPWLVHMLVTALFSVMGWGASMLIPVTLVIAVTCLVLVVGVTMLAGFFLGTLFSQHPAIAPAIAVLGMIIGVGVFVALLFWLAGWRRTRGEDMALGTFLLCALAGKGIADLWGNPLAGGVIGALWFIFSILIYHYCSQRLEATWGANRTPPVLLARLTIGWPYTVMDWSGKYALAPAIAAYVLALIAIPYDRFFLLLPMWVICALAAYGLDMALAACGRLLADQPWKGWLQLSLLLIWLVWTLAYLRAPEAWTPALLLRPDRLSKAWVGLWMIGLLPGGLVWSGWAMAKQARRLWSWFGK